MNALRSFDGMPIVNKDTLKPIATAIQVSQAPMTAAYHYELIAEAAALVNHALIQ